MPISLERRFNPCREEVLDSVRQYGIAETMAIYKVKHRPTFVRWLEAQTNVVFPYNPLARLKGGEKHKWLREHRQTVLELEAELGREFVKECFCLKEETLEALLQYEPNTPAHRLTKSDRALAKAEINEQAIKDLRKEIKELRGEFATFQESASSQPTRQFLPFSIALNIDEPDLSVNSLITQAQQQ